MVETQLHDAIFLGTTSISPLGVLDGMLAPQRPVTVDDYYVYQEFLFCMGPFVNERRSTPKSKTLKRGDLIDKRARGRAITHSPATDKQYT